MEIEVVAAVFCSDDRVLCLRRSGNRSMAGLWEFPGGKVEAGESLSAALVREIKEELGVDIEVGNYLGENLYPPMNSSDDNKHEQSDQRIRLHAFTVTVWSGCIRLVDHDRLLWSAAKQLHVLNWSPADVPFVDLLCNGTKHNDL